MGSLTNEEAGKIDRGVCPDCGASDGFLKGPSGPGATNVMCKACKMQFNLGMGCYDRIGFYKETVVSEPVSLPGEGHVLFKNDGKFEYLTHSCCGSIDFHVVSDEHACITCRKCGMRIRLPNRDLKGLTIQAYKVRDLFEYLKTKRELEGKLRAIEVVAEAGIGGLP